MGFFEGCESCLDRGLLVGRNLIAEFVELFFGLENDCVGLIEFVDALLFFCVGGCIGGCFVFHTFDLGVGQAAGGFDADALFFAGGFIFGRYVEDAVGVDLEGHFDLRDTAGCGCDAVEVEFAECLVVLGHGAFALEYVDFRAFALEYVDFD